MREISRYQQSEISILLVSAARGATSQASAYRLGALMRPFDTIHHLESFHITYLRNVRLDLGILQALLHKRDERSGRDIACSDV